MNHFAKIAEKLNTYGLDGMLLTCEANRFYASGFHSTGTDGVALVTREGNFYFTDSATSRLPTIRSRTPRSPRPTRPTPMWT